MEKLRMISQGLQKLDGLSCAYSCRPSENVSFQLPSGSHTKRLIDALLILPLIRAIVQMKCANTHKVNTALDPEDNSADKSANKPAP
ncbi:MAG: hypothetical protein OI74_01060 [Gammaproteobacteria bacterium (ex Lamellibrachia satsuma)]|nr:MAG: hypothetical protein HPY30_18255 [Gammaproteobacteria bacterium (ex Lamellibrachia satsuma)]RRS35975.1 MAG: hypothetical protein OI74_01060 [Gammaproteobacteria bacterium (ex Lamellibrachia satsuma)]RRS36567.1 MAG: hypothetical protein NV67_06730 [Gammaproteobacteria bacterium (ex Lamellibrachia satsuma)]